MTAMENAIRMVLRALDIDVESVKSDVAKRVENFEANVTTLNNTLILLHQKQRLIDEKLDLLLTEHGIEIPTAKENGHDAGTGLSTVT